MPLVVGVPREQKLGEHRVAITPDGVHELTVHGAPVIIEHDAGEGSSISDDDFRAAGAKIASDADEVWGEAELVLKVKEPQAEELERLRPGLVLFTYLHLAAYPAVADALLEHHVTGIAYETVQTASGALPLLAPMSEVAGRMAPQVGSHFLEREHGGRGVLLGGAPGVRPARVVVLGAGNVGWNAAWIAEGMEAEVLLLDRNLDRLRWVDQIHKGRIMTLASNRLAVERAVTGADLVIGAVLVPGGRAPIVLTDEVVASMRAGRGHRRLRDRPGWLCRGHSRDVARRADLRAARCAPLCGRQHPRRSAPHVYLRVLTNATLPYVTALATQGVVTATREDPELAHGVNTVDGRVTNAAVAEALRRDVVSLEDALVS